MAKTNRLAQSDARSAVPTFAREPICFDCRFDVRFVRHALAPFARVKRSLVTPETLAAAFSATGQRKCLAVVTCSPLPDIHSVVPGLVNLERTLPTLDCVDICSGSAEESLSQGMRTFIP
jgi:hypothetical protein